VLIIFDALGVPHIQARIETDAFFGLGYMHSRDRRFQMELLKFVASGRIRELIGSENAGTKLIEQEIFNRMVGLNQDGLQLISTSAAEDLAILEAYADGVNTATNKERIPLEFRLLGIKPEPWRAVDSATIIAMFSFGLCKNWELELGRLEFLCCQLQQGLPIQRALDIWKPWYDLPPHLIAMDEEVGKKETLVALAPELLALLQEWVGHSDVEVASVREQCSRVTVSPNTYGLGSNSWAVGGRWTGTGKGALAADPHMPYSIPPLGYLAHLECTSMGGAAMCAIGGGFPGIPAILFGTNGEVAWGVASNWADVTDLYVEQSLSDPNQYLFRDGTEAFEDCKEVFRIRDKHGHFTEEVRHARRSRHGILLNDILLRLPEKFPLVSLKRNEDLGAPIRALRQLYLSTTAQEAVSALESFHAMVGHWVLSDTCGNVSYCGPVKLPKRTAHMGTIPVPGWTGTYEWEEFVLPGSLPEQGNPPSDFVAAANNQVVSPERYPFPINYEGDVPFRYVRLQERLCLGNNGEPIVEQMRQLQLDCKDLGYEAVRQLWESALVPLSQEADPLVALAAQTLLVWNGDCRPEEVAPTLFHALSAALIKHHLRDEMTTSNLKFVLNYYNIEPLVYDLVGNPANPAWGTATQVQAVDPLPSLKSVFRTTVKELAKVYGADLREWVWTRTAPFYLKHPLGSHPVLGAYMNRGPLRTCGSNNTLNKQYAFREESTCFPVVLGPVLRINVDLADLAGSVMSLPGGQSGRPASRHYDDLLPLFLEGRGASMDIDFIRLKAGALGRLQLLPAPDRTNHLREQRTIRIAPRKK
jgi:penicillin amidase